MFRSWDGPVGDRVVRVAAGRGVWAGPGRVVGCRGFRVTQRRASVTHSDCLFDVKVMKHSMGYRSENFPLISDLASSELRYFTRLAQHLVDFAEVLFFFRNHFPRIFLE